MKISVILSASEVDDKWKRHLDDLIDVIKNDKVMFGGDPNGLMGYFGKRCINKNIDVIGVTTDIIIERKGHFEGLSTEIRTASFDERKSIMIKSVDAIICYPGGSGSYEEMFQAISWRQTGQTNAKTIFYNIDGFYNLIKSHYEFMLKEGFIGEDYFKQIYFVNSPQELKGVLYETN